MHFDHILALVQVLDHGSVLGAARATGIARGTLRSRLDALEQSLGVAVLAPSHDGVALTPAGTQILPHLKDLLDTRSDLMRQLDQHANGASSVIHVVMLSGPEPVVTTAILRGALAAMGDARFELECAADPLAAASPGTDLVIHLGDPPTEPRWYSRVIERLDLVLVASQAYLDLHGSPASIAELEDHDLFLFNGPAWPHARLPTPDGPVPCRPVFQTANIDLLRWAASTGCGIALVPDGGLPESPGRPPVVPVLRDLVHASLPLRASTRNRALPRVERILEAFGNAVPADR